MKLKKIFALALAVCMMVSAMPTTLAADGVLTSGGTSGSGDGVLTSGGGSSSLTLTSGGSTVSRITSGSVQPRQDGVLYSTGSGDQGGTTPVDDPIVPVLDEPKATDTENLGKGSDSYRGPALDEKDYTLSKTASKVGAANANPGDPNTSDKIAIDKTVTDNKNGTYTISLSASTASSTVTVAAPGNIVLVLDASESMQGDETIGGVTKTKAVWLEEAVDNFLDAVPAGSNVAIVGYGDSAYCHTNTNLSKAFLPVDTKLAELKSATDDVRKATLNETYNSRHGKYTNKGLKMAVEILQASNSDLPSIVVLFTDGTPSADLSAQTWWQETDFKIAQEALHWATILKSDAESTPLNYNDKFYSTDSKSSSDTFAGKLNGCDADVYCVTIGLPEKNLSSSCESHPAYWLGFRCNCCVANEFLWRASSMRPDSSNRSGWEGNYSDDRTHGGKYYLVGSMANVGDLFGNIEVENGLTLGNVTVKDVLPAYMEVVNSNGGTTTFDAATGKTTIAWAGELVPGKPVSETLTVKFKDGFLGGHSVPTNDAASGIYVGDTMAAAFGIPTVNVPVPEITYVTAVDKNIYLGKTLSNAELLEGVKATYTAGGKTFTIDPTKTNFGLESWQTAYTNSIVFSVKDETVFTLGCTITPNEAQTTIYQPVSKTGNATITVFKPHITFNDSTIYLGVEADYEDNHDEDCVQWFDDAGNPAENMIGDEPSVTVKYDQPTGFFTKCEDISVETVELGDYEAELNDVTFANADDTAKDHQFTVHVLEPVIVSEDKIIFLGNELGAALNATHTWACEDGNTTASAGYAEPEIGADDYDYEQGSKPVSSTDKPTGCHADYKASVTLAGKKVFSAETFAVHVRKPTVKYQDTTIYLGDTPNYDENNLIDTITWDDKSDKEKGAIVGEAPKIDDFEFTYQNNVDHMVCNIVNVTGVTIKGDDYTGHVAFTNDTTTATDTVKFKVHVLQPVVSVVMNDTTAYYGDEYVLGTGVNEQITLDWSDTDQNESWINLIGDAPYTDEDLSLNYAIPGVEGQTIIMPNNDVTVTATVMLNGEEFEDSETTFVTTCTTGCTDKTDGTYVVHPLTCTLTIKNNGTNALDVNQNFIFNVTGDNETYPVDVTVVIDGDGTATIVGLPVGTYTVSTEDDWSWRYEVVGETENNDQDTAELTASSEGSAKTVNVTQKRTLEKWLDAIAVTVKNIFKGGRF